jgi:hypothetical protein
MLVLAKEEAELAKFTDSRADIALATPTAWSWLLSALDYRSLTHLGSARGPLCGSSVVCHSAYYSLWASASSRPGHCNRNVPDPGKR